jgi:hypothetical protein
MRLPCGLLPSELARVRSGFFPGRSGEIQLVPREPNFVGAYRSHSGPWDYLQEVPLFLYGPGHVTAAGRVDRAATVADLAPTLAEHMDFPFAAADGRALPEGMPSGGGSGPPRALVVVVWDGVGRNVLARHPDAWPTLRSLIQEGAWFEHATIGSSPSVTAAVHATIGTGALPQAHGRVANRFRFQGTMASVNEAGPEDLIVPTLADLWDRSEGNAAQVALVAFREWHAGMVGHGALFPGGDRDMAVLMDERSGRWDLPADELPAFEFPAYAPSVGGLASALRELDLVDGELDGLWRGEDLDDPNVAVRSPAYSLWQTKLLERIVEEEEFGTDAVPDLLFTNYKQPDLVGHRWGMESPRMAESVRAVDEALADLIEVLDAGVGEGEWVLALTADHGSTPAPGSTGAMVIDEGRLVDAIRARFDGDEDDRSVLLALSPSQVWLDREELAEEGMTPAAVASFIAGYDAGDNAPDPGALPPARRNDPLFAGAFPSRLLRLPDCGGP